MSDLYPTVTLGDLTLTEYPYGLLFDYDLGAGEVTYESLVSQMLDGEPVSSPRTGNRTISLPIMVEGADLLDVAANAEALWAECSKSSNVLTIDPGDGFAPAGAFDTYRVDMVRRASSENEQHNVRIYDLNIPALPWVRSVDLTTQPAVAVDSSLVVVDDCSSATGWRSEGGVVISSGSVVTTELNSDKILGISRDGSISMTGMAYIVVDWTSSSPADIKPYVVPDKEVLRTTSPFGASYYRSYFHQPSNVSSGINFFAGGLPIGGTFSITQVAKAASLPDSGTGGHQQLLTIAPGGSARTQAQLEVTTAANGLGEVTLYTAPAGNAYTPTIRRHLVSSDTVVTNPAGSYQPIVGASVYQVPVSTLLPGGYAVWARMACTTTADVPIVWNAGSWVNGTAVGDAQGDTLTCSFTANIWKMYPLGLATLPPAKVGPAGNVRIGIQRGSSAATVYLYDVFLFHESGDLTVVRCGLGASASGGSSRRLRVLPPSPENPGGLLERGHATDWSDAFAAGSNASARPARGHVLHPEGTSVFVFTEGTPDNSPASVSASWHKRWLDLPGE